MKTNTFKISEAIKIVSNVILFKYNLLRELDDDATEIRTAINNLLDLYEKDGFKVNHEYDQERAVKIVQNKVRKVFKESF
jgi:hypothetical protein